MNADQQFELKAEVNAGSLTGAVRPATLNIALSLGDIDMDGSVTVAGIDWTRISNKEWKLKSKKGKGKH